MRALIQRWNPPIKQLVSAFSIFVLIFLAVRASAEENECPDRTSCVRQISEEGANVSYCRENKRGQRTYLPTLENGCAESLECRICGLRGGAEVDCKEHAVLPANRPVGGWASELVWCDVDGIRWTCTPLDKTTCRKPEPPPESKPAPGRYACGMRMCCEPGTEFVMYAECQCPPGAGYQSTNNGRMQCACDIWRHWDADKKECVTDPIAPPSAGTPPNPSGGPSETPSTDGQGKSGSGQPPEKTPPPKNDRSESSSGAPGGATAPAPSTIAERFAAAEQARNAYDASMQGALATTPLGGGTAPLKSGFMFHAGIGAAFTLFPIIQNTAQSTNVKASTEKSSVSALSFVADIQIWPHVSPYWGIGLGPRVAIGAFPLPGGGHFLIDARGNATAYAGVPSIKGIFSFDYGWRHLRSGMSGVSQTGDDDTSAKADYTYKRYAVGASITLSREDSNPDFAYSELIPMIGMEYGEFSPVALKFIRLTFIERRTFAFFGEFGWGGARPGENKQHRVLENDAMSAQFGGQWSLDYQ